MPTEESHNGAGVSRRQLIRRLPLVAAAGIGAAVLGDTLAAGPALAHVGDPLSLGSFNDADSASTTIASAAASVLTVLSPEAKETDIAGASITLSDPLNGGGAFLFLSDEPSSGGPEGTTHARLAINDGPALLSVDGRTTGSKLGLGGHPAIAATGRGSVVMTVQGTSGSTVNGDGSTTEVPSVGIGVTVNETGVGAVVVSQSGHALEAGNVDPATTEDVAIFRTAGLGRAVLGESTNLRNRNASVTGINDGMGAGVWGTQNNAKSTSPAVVGQAQALGRGGQFGGGAAALRMMPGTASTHPPTGLLGDFFVDSRTRLWFCKGGATWHQLA